MLLEGSLLGVETVVSAYWLERGGRAGGKSAQGRAPLKDWTRGRQ